MLPARLVDKSLVTADAVEPEYRYRMLETLRAYGLEELNGQGMTAEVRALIWPPWQRPRGAGNNAGIHDDRSNVCPNGAASFRGGCCCEQRVLPESDSLHR
jgi:hypothetical protein